MDFFNPTPTIATEKKQAEDYDQFQERVHGAEFKSMRNFIVSALSSNSEDKMRVLDCGTGTGDIAIRIADTFSTASIVGIDASEEYLNVFSKKISDKGLEGRVFSKKSDLRGEFSVDLGIFDYAVSQYVFHYKFDRIKLFSEIYRMLKPSGKLIFGVVVPSEDQFENSKYFLQVEENSYNFYIEHDFSFEESRRNAKRDRLWLMTYSEAHGSTDHLPVWINDLQRAGFIDPKCLWRVSMDTVISATKPAV
ncbi:MAG: class I SAM-dependent methyltransferase [Candidatus Uhrbacteria bacterium]|nr:class I SAM-dependent methyltransferase [Candidatus Uhrbacteria bacterium]